MDRTRWIIFASICVVVFGVLIFNKKTADTNVNVDKIDAAKVITSDSKKEIADHIFGTTSAKVVMIEYGDFQCTACASFYPGMHSLKEKYKDQLTFVFRNFPLTAIHPNALAASTAAEAAGLQDKWWQYHDKLYENQTAWSDIDVSNRTDIFVSYAKELGLNITTFKKDLESKKVADKIAKDQALGKKIGTSGTPTLVINGKTLDQSKWGTPQKLEATIRTAIKDSGQTLPN